MTRLQIAYRLAWLYRRAGMPLAYSLKTAWRKAR